jgi:hypothetical protein
MTQSKLVIILKLAISKCTAATPSANKLYGGNLNALRHQNVPD